MSSIPYDWNKRLKKDSKEFLQNITSGNYDFEVIYNAYPERVNGEVSNEIVSFVARQLCKGIIKEPHKYDDFLLFIYKQKGRTGRYIFNLIFTKLIVKYPEQYINIVQSLWKDIHDNKEMQNLFSMVIYPLLKKYPDKYIDKLFNWIREEDDLVVENMFRVLERYVKYDKMRIKEIFHKSESFWNFDNPTIRKGNVRLLRAIYKANPKFCEKIYLEYKGTHNPNFVEILCGGIAGYTREIEQEIELWAKSGNARIRKSALSALRSIKKYKKYYTTKTPKHKE